MHISLPIPFLHRRERRITSEIIGYTACGVYIVTTSTYVAFSKLLLTSLSPLSMLFLSESLSLAFTLLSFGFLPILRELLKLRRKQIVPLILIALCNSVLAPLLAFIGVMQTHVANVALFGQTDVLFLFLLAVACLHERIDRQQILSGFIIVLGIVIVALKGFTGALTLARGDTLILASAAVYAIGSILFKKYLHTTHPEAVMFVRGMMAMLTFLIASLFIEHGFVEEVSLLTGPLLGIMISYGFFTRFLGLFSFYEALDRVPVHILSLLLPIGTVGNIAFAWGFLHEAITWYHIVGGACILFGALVMQFNVHRFTPEEQIERQMQQHRKHL